MVEHVGVVKAHQRITHPMQQSGSHIVRRFAPRVGVAVQLNDQLHGMAVEVGDEGAEWHLASELVAAELAIP